MKDWLERNKKALVTSIGIAFYALVALFLVLYARTIDWESFWSIEIHWGYLALATALGLITRFWFARIWIFFLSNSGASLDKKTTRELYVVYARSWLGRYIPGSVAWVIGKVYFASKLGISKMRLAVSSYIEAVLQIVTVLLSATILLLFDPRSYELAGNWIWIILAVAVAGFIAVIPPVMRGYAGKAYQLIRGKTLEAELIPSNKVLAKGVGFFVVSSLLSGLALFFVALAVVPEIGFGEVLFVLAASNLASAVSMVAVFAPAGIGVREAIQVAALLVLMEPEQALATALLMRVMSIAWDGQFLLLASIRKTEK